MTENENISKLLESFHPISLQEMDSVKLMNRTDTKYFFPLSKLPAILHAANNYYTILTINRKQIAFYKTLYYDTPDFNNYINHHNGKLNRFKIRIRHYVDSDIFFLEEKFKNNKGRTIKKRIRVNGFMEKFTKEEQSFISKYTPLNTDNLEPKLLNSFQRITLVQPADKERITIDIGLMFSDNKQQNIQLKNIVIVEIKKDGRTRSVMEHLFREKHIHTSGFSKYCTGIASLYPQVKLNCFKYKLLQIKKLEYGTT